MNRDIVSGLALAAIGAAASLYAYTHYSIGSAVNMGPGFFPFYLGIILAVLGLLISTMSIGTKVLDNTKTSFSSLVLIASSIVLFGVVLDYLGLIIATVVSVTLATFASQNYSSRTSRILVAVTVAAINCLVFVLVLRMNITLWI
jgi:hypothetical protein